MHLLLKREVVPVVARLQALKQVGFIEDRLLLVGLRSRVHLQEYAGRFVQPDGQGNAGLPQAFLEYDEVVSARSHLLG